MNMNSNTEKSNCVLKEEKAIAEVSKRNVFIDLLNYNYMYYKAIIIELQTFFVMTYDLIGKDFM